MNQYSFEDMIPGMAESFFVEITEELQQKFDAVSGDVNPLHKDAEFAKKHGFQDRVVYGMLASSFYSTLVGVYLPGEKCLINECKVSYHKPVYIGDRLVVEGTLSDIREGARRMKVAGKMTNQSGELVNAAVITVSFTAEP